MSALEHRMLEDRTMRNSAKALFQADLAHVRSDLSSRSIGDRIGDRIGESAVDFADEAVDFAGENKGVIAAGITALLIWLMRAPLLAWLFGEEGDENDRERENPEHR